MKCRGLEVVFFMLILGMVSSSWSLPVARVVEEMAETIVIEVQFGKEDFNLSKEHGYDVIVGRDLVLLPQPGLPSLPRLTVHVAIPEDKSVKDVVAVPVETTRLQGNYNIMPIQPPAILGTAIHEWIEGDPSIYSSDRGFPENLVSAVKEGFLGGERIVGFYVSPFIWNPRSGELTVCNRILVKLNLTRAISGAKRRRSVATGPIREMVKKIVVNPHSLEPSTIGMDIPLGTNLEPGNYEYVVVTVDSLSSYFEPLARWKTQKGVPAKIVTREWIESTYQGENVQEQIRNFIIDAYQTWGTAWVLLGGDTGIIPSRQVFAMDAEMGIAGNRIRADLYYSDLDGNWNANGVAPYGEVADSVDMYPDVIVGRAPVENTIEAEVFVEKVLTYEKTPPIDYTLKMLMAGEILWVDPYTDSGQGLNMIDEECVPPRFDPIEKLYESLGNESRESVLASISRGNNFIFHDGHAYYYVMGAGDGSIYTEDADTVSNAPRYSILNSIGCWPAAIDKDCIAEHFINNPQGGCVAFIGNCRYGWGSPGNPGLGYSDKFQFEFARQVFVEDAVHVGLALAMSKAVFVPFAGDENVYRWNEYQVNLLGDPEMPMWTDIPRQFEVEYPSSVVMNGDEVTVCVEYGGMAVRGARVCIMNETDLYCVGTTDESGSVTFSVSTTSPDSLSLTVTGYNYLPFTAKIPVTSEGPMLSVSEYGISDSNDGLPNPGESVGLELKIRNTGTEGTSGVSGILRSKRPECTVLDSVVYFGAVDSGGIAWATSNPTLIFGSELSDGDAIGFELVLTDTMARVWNCGFTIVVCSPVLEARSYGVQEIEGDNDWIVEPGEEVLLSLEIWNVGLAPASDVSATVTSDDPFISVADSVSEIGSVQASGRGFSLHKVNVSESVPSDYIAALSVQITADGGLSFTDTVYFVVGAFQFCDDCEGTSTVWTRTGSPDLWHRSTYRAHSDSSSWYFGYESTHQYPSYAHSSLTSPDFIAGEDVTLSFWFWYDLTTYGVDGVYVIVNKNGVLDTLDFIGSGGALDSQGALNIVSDWVKWTRQLKDVEPGDTISITFKFVSDESDVSEGVYIDDICLRSRQPVKTGISSDDSCCLPNSITVYPNPAQSGEMVRFATRRRALSVKIYDVHGRLIRQLVVHQGSPLEWNLTDSRGKPVAAGIYLAKFDFGSYSLSRKVVVLR